jgi:hypothetical protein
MEYSHIGLYFVMMVQYFVTLLGKYRWSSKDVMIAISGYICVDEFVQDEDCRHLKFQLCLFCFLSFYVAIILDETLVIVYLLLLFYSFIYRWFSLEFCLSDRLND